MPKSEEKMKKMMSTCICGSCPSYKGTGETALLFCSTEKSKKTKEEKGCICGRCPVTVQMGLKHGYYCARGSEKKQSTKK